MPGSAREDILKAAFGAEDFKSTALFPPAGDVDKLFAAFVQYAASNWDYAAQSGAGRSEDLLAGSGRKQVDCGKLRGALKLMIREQWGVGAAQDADINDYFLTRPGVHCFDPKVTGNVAKLGSRHYDLACHFSAHYFLSSGGTFYDACLKSTYASIEGPIFVRTSRIDNPGGVPMRLAGRGLASMVLRLVPDKKMVGFGAVWEQLTFGELERGLTSEQLAAAKRNPTLKLAGL